tara:strand:- start:152 stop:265 length:114 start_codon:yes stop_codon:yes gene_type:complete
MIKAMKTYIKGRYVLSNLMRKMASRKAAPVMLAVDIQ